VSEPYPTKGRSELGTVTKETMDVSRQKRTQPDAKKDGPVPGKKGNQLTADSVPNPSPRSEERKSSGSNNPDHTKNCREDNKENDIEKTDDSPEANREALSPKIRHASIGNALTSGRTNYHQRQKKRPIVEQDQKEDNQWLLGKTTASTGSTALKNGADIVLKQRGITQSASETTEDCKRQAVRTVASQKNKGVTPTQSNESLDINPESEKPPIPEPEGEVSRALNQEKIKIQLPGNLSQALLHKIKNQQRKIKAKAMGISNVISHMDITANPKAVARAGEVWSQIEESRREYQSMLDEAFKTLGGDAGLTKAMADDEKQLGWRNL
jgi:hypothetical protein